MSRSAYKRILLKLSGEALAGEGSYGIDPAALNTIAKEIREVAGMGVSMGVVVGGGNIFRGSQASAQGLERVTADHMGMLATVINGLALQNALESVGILTRLMTAISMEAVAEPYIRRRALRHLEKGRVVIFAGGTGNPYFTTDSAAALRAVEVQAELLLKATKVDGVYDSDPKSNSDAVRFDTISYIEALEKSLKVMDATAISLCMENRIPIRVFDLFESGNIARIVSGEKLGTLIS